MTQGGTWQSSITTERSTLLELPAELKSILEEAN
jgi:hypothetical protein